MGENFSEKFYNLEGVHYTERKKNFNLLLKATDRNILEQHFNIQPRNDLESIFFVDILIYLKKAEQLIEVLQGGDELLISRVLKQEWFFKEVAAKMTDEELIDSFFPSLSYSVRMKVLKKLALSLNEERMDCIFDRVVQKYGLYVGQQVLFSCTSYKIIHTLKNNKIILSTEQLKRLLHKDHELVKVYIEEFERQTSTRYTQSDFLRYLIWKRPKLYEEFDRFLNQTNVKLGRKTTKQVLNSNLNVASHDTNDLLQKFNSNVMARQIDGFDADYLHKLFPSDVSKASSALGNYKTFLKSYPRKKRWAIFSTAFRKAYNECASKYLASFGHAFVEIFSSKDLEQKASELYQSNNDTFFIRYMPPAEALIVVKKQADLVASAFDRSTLIRDLIFNCRTKKDYNTYELVVKYIWQRHRNVATSIRATWLSDIATDIDYDLTTENFWSFIKELVNLHLIKKETVPEENIVQFLIFLYKKGVPIEEEMMRYLNCFNDRFSIMKENCLNNHLDVKRELLKCGLTMLPGLNQELRRKWDVLFVKETVDFNKAHPDSWIDLNEFDVIPTILESILAKNAADLEPNDVTFIKHIILYNYEKGSKFPLKGLDTERLLETIKLMIIAKKEYLYRISPAIITAIRTPRTTKFQDQLADYLFTELLPRHTNYFNYQTDIRSFLRDEPEMMVKYIDFILPYELSASLIDHSALHLYAHLKLDVKLVQYLKPFVTLESDCKSKPTLIEALSKVMETDAYLKLIASYIPKKDASKFEQMDEQQRDRFNVQVAVIKSLKNCCRKDAAKLLPLLPDVCQGDYFQTSLQLLLKVIRRVNESEVRSYVSAALDKAVSVRKHALILSFEVLSQNEAVEVFNSRAAKEGNASVKKYMYRSLLAYFLKNPTQELLDKCLLSVTFIDTKDKESLQLLTEAAPKLPTSLSVAFAQGIWEFLDTTEPIADSSHKKNLLVTMNSWDSAVFSTINEEFCTKLIRKYFLPDGADDDPFGVHFYKFVANYLQSRAAAGFGFVFGLIRAYKDRCWASTHGCQRVFTFFDKVFVYRYFEHEDFFRLFKSHWNAIFTLTDCLNEYFLMELTDSYKTSSDVDGFAASVSKKILEIVDVYGQLIVSILLKSMKAFVRDKPTHNEPRLAMALLNCSNDETHCYIAYGLLKGYQKSVDRNMCLDVLNALKSVNSFSVNILYNDLQRSFFGN